MEEALVDVPVAAPAIEFCPSEQRVTGVVVRPLTIVLVGPGHEAIGRYSGVGVEPVRSGHSYATAILDTSHKAPVSQGSISLSVSYWSPTQFPSEKQLGDQPQDCRLGVCERQ